MSVKKWLDKNGKSCWHISKLWPNGKRLRRKVPSKREGERLQARIDTAILNGTWLDLSQDLSRNVDQPPTIREFSEVYLNEYCRTHNRSLNFKQEKLRIINRTLGNIRVSDFKRADAYAFIEVRRKEVKPATINRDIAVLKNMLTYAIDKGLLYHHPLLKFGALPEKPKALKLMTLEEERQLVASVSEISPVVGAFVAILGETAIRKSEGLHLQWNNVDLDNMIISLDHTKNGKIRHVPLSRFALETFISLPKSSSCPYVFYNHRMRNRWKEPRETFDKGKREAGLPWVRLHDLRHFRASQWVMNGMDLRTVQELLGHSSLSVTQRYAHLAPAHAMKHVQRIASAEEQNMKKMKQKWTPGGDY